MDFVDIHNSTRVTNDKNLNRFLLILLISISIPSILINLFAIRRLHFNTKSSVFAFRCILHLSLFTICTCLPFFLVELFYNSYFPLPISFCRLWIIMDYSSIVCIGLFVCWASIQRHIFIFGSIQTRKLHSKIRYKLCPLLLILILPITWYSVLVFTCEYSIIQLKHFRCRPCFENMKFVFLIDIFLSLICPLTITILVNFLLLIRLIRLRFNLFNSNRKKWRRCKRLTHQMILFTTIYLIGLLPYVLANLNTLYQFWPNINLSSYLQIANALTYVPCCFSSFLSIYIFPEIWKVHRKHRRDMRKTSITFLSSSEM